MLFNTTYSYYLWSFWSK